MEKKKIYRYDDYFGEPEDDISIYSRNVRESLVDDDELSPIEDAFMEGYENAI